MNKKIYDYLEIKDLKDMLNKTGKLYAKRPAYKIKVENGKYKTRHSLCGDNNTSAEACCL